MVASPTFHAVLIVEDEGRIAETISIILKKSGFLVLVAKSGEEAIQIISAFTPDWLLSDVVLGDMNGIDTAIRIRELCPACQMLLMSGNAMTSELLHDARLRGHDFEILVKPFHPIELLSRLAA